MLRAAGLDARLAELTTRDENFFHRSFPDAFQFNSELTAVISRDGSVQFFDPGTVHCPPGLLSWEKEGITALVYGTADWRFVETPVSDASQNAEERIIRVVARQDGDVEAHVDLKFTGQRAIELRSQSADQAPDVLRKQILVGLRDLLPAARIDESSVTVSNPKSAVTPVVASFDFRTLQFATRTETRLFVRPAFLSHRDESVTPAPARANSICFPYPWSESDRVVIEPPPGYKIEQLPDPVDLDIGAAHFRSTVSREGNNAVYERRLVVNAINFSVDQYPTVKAFFDRVLQADRAAVSFKQLP
jgi:hypothetical protein